MADVKFEEIGPDEVLVKAKGFWDKYSKTILIASAAVILVVGGYLGYKSLLKNISVTIPCLSHSMVMQGLMAFLK
jgi:hypothetical protein